MAGDDGEGRSGIVVVAACEQVHSTPIRSSDVIHQMGNLGLVRVERRIDPEVRATAIRLTYSGLEPVEILFHSRGFGQCITGCSDYLTDSGLIAVSGTLCFVGCLNGCIECLTLFGDLTAKAIGSLFHCSGFGHCTVCGLRDLRHLRLDGTRCLGKGTVGGVISCRLKILWSWRPVSWFSAFFEFPSIFWKGINTN